jgi:acyl-CoA thioesterase I
VNWILYLFGAGFAFFLGVGLVLAGLLTFSARQYRGVIAATSLSVAGLVVIAFSAAPLPYWLYGVNGGLTALWLAVERGGCQTGRRRLRWLRIAVAVLWTGAVAVELPYQFQHSLSPTPGRPTLYVIGDSVAAGIGGVEATWPKLIARNHQVDVVDLSRAGASTAEAQEQAGKLPPSGGIVLLEIGGNDLLGSTSAEEFGRELDQLLGRVCKPGRIVLMVELPLPPFCNGYGQAQRRLCAAYGVVLIPRRVIMRELTRKGATIDGIHFTREGHERMAEAMWEAVRSAYDE